MNKLRYFYKTYLRPEDKIILLSLLTAMAIGVVYILINAFETHYTGNQFINWQFFLGLPLMLTLFSVALFAKTISPRMSLITWTYTTYFFMLLGLGTLVYGTQFTPFHPIDATLVKIDHMLGFSQTAVLDWTYDHHWLARLFNQAYSSIGMQMTFIPLILAVLLDKRAINVLFMGIIFSFIIGTAIYYFFPTTAPASLFFDPNFALQQHDTFIKFFEIHHHLPITTQEGGLVAFPSFHVVWCVLLAYSLRHTKLLFYPIAALNAVIIVSTTLLGWHYLTDVLGGITMAAATLWACEVIHKKYIVKNDATMLTPETTIKTVVPTIEQLPTPFPQWQSNKIC